MDTIGVRELQQRASAVLRRVEQGEMLGVTDRGRLVAVIGPPSTANGIVALTRAGRVRPARGEAVALPPPVVAARSVADVLDDLRSDA